MKRIAIFQADLKVGGIQRSLINLLESPILKNYEVDVYLFSRNIFYDVSRLTKNIHLYYLDPFPYWFRFIPFRFIRHMKFYSDIEQKYDYVFDFDSYRQECAYCTIKMKNAKRIMWIHNDVERKLRFEKKYRILYFFFKGKYKFYDEFVAVSEGIVEPFRKCSGCKDSKIVVIPNIINVKEILDKCHEQSDVFVDSTKYNVVCIGKICVQKGYDFLLKDIYEAYQRRANLRCYIIGDGPDCKRYKKWVIEQGLSDVVFFLGNQKNPYAIMNRMDAFCLESRYEGQGIVLWEAKCLGLQLVFPKRLEKYNGCLEGVENVVEALMSIKKEKKKCDYLREYHEHIEMQYKTLLGN